MRKSSDTLNKSFQFLKQNWLFILIALYAMPYIYGMYKDNKAKISKEDEEAEKKYLESISGNPTKQDEYMKEDTTHKERQIARDVYHHLGFAYSWYDPRRWTENDKEVYDLLKDFNPIPKGIHIAYYTISAGRSLKADCLKVLDSQYYKLLKW